MKYRSSLFFICSLIYGLLSFTSYSQGRKDRALETGLFEEDGILSVTLKMNIDAVTADIEDRDDHYAELTYIDQGTPVNVPLQVRTRGKTRANPKICSFPPLRLNFKKKGNYENIFAGQDKLKLVTHCKSSKVFNQYILQEYLTYRLYNILTDYSLKVRLLQIQYLDSANTDKSFERYGFLIEDIDLMAHRNGMVEREDGVRNQDFCDKKILDIMSVFQYMIGNTDWSVPAFHNIKLIATDSTSLLPVPVPYDFDYAGIVSTHYAVVPETLPIENVRTRLFRGFCRQNGYSEVFELFNQKKEAIYSLYQNFELLSERNKKSTLKYFDRFYDTINNPKRASSAFNGACRVDHQHFE